MSKANNVNKRQQKQKVMSKANIVNKRQQKQKVMPKVNIVQQETVETQSRKLIMSTRESKTQSDV